MAQTLADLVVKFSADTDKFNAGMKGMSSEMQARMNEMRQFSLRASVALGALAVGSAGVVSSLVNTAKRFEVMRTQLQLTLGSTEAVNQKMKEFGQIAKDSMNFSLESVVQAGAVLEHFKKGSSEALPAIAGLSERLGKDLPGSAEVFARAMAGDARSLQVIARQFNITKEMLSQFDSAFDMTGQNAQKNGEILAKYLNAKYGDDLKTTAGTLESQMGTLKMTIEELSASIGTAMLPTIKEWAGNLQKVADRFNSMSEGQKKLMANILMLTPVVAGAGSGIALMGNQIIMFSGHIWGAIKAVDAYIVKQKVMAMSQNFNFMALKKTTSFLPKSAVGYGVLGIAITATALSVNKLANALREEFEWRERIKQIQLKNADDQQREEKAYKRFTQGLVMTAQERVDAIQEIYRRMRIAREYGNAEDLKSLENQLAKIRALTKGSEGSQAPAMSISGGSTVDIEAEQAKMERDIVLLERRKELQGLTNAQTKELIGLYRTMASTRQNEAKVAQDKEEQNRLDSEAHDWRVKAKTLNDELIKQETKKSEVQKISAIEAVDGNKQIVSSLGEVVGAINKTMTAEIDRQTERKRLAEQLDDDIRRITMKSEDYEIYKIQKKVEELRSAGVEEVKITAWVEAQRQDLMEKSAKKGSDKVAEVKSKFEELKNELEGLSRKGFLSMDEAMRKISLRTQMTFADTGSGGASTTRPAGMSLPSVADITGAGGSGKNGNTPAMASRTVNYNVSVNGLQIGGETGKKIAELMTNALVGKNDMLAGAETV